MSFRRSVTRDIAQPCNKESGSHVARQQRIKAVHKIPRIKRENGVHKLEAETISDLCTPIPSERRVTNWARHSGAEFRRQSIEGRTCVLSDFPFARIQGCRTADLGRAIEVNSPLSKLIGARVIVAPLAIATNLLAGYNTKRRKPFAVQPDAWHKRTRVCRVGLPILCTSGKLLVSAFC
jgi:hypothetical protein